VTTLHDASLIRVELGEDRSMALTFESAGRDERVLVEGARCPTLWCDGVLLPYIVSCVIFRSEDSLAAPEWDRLRPKIEAVIDEYGMDDWYLVAVGAFGGAFCVLVRNPRG
jgi:hypothetical protein